jgi:alkylated DNA repair dioxygenase AlkB
MLAFVSSTQPEQTEQPEKILYEQPGAELVQRNMSSHKELIDEAVKEVKHLLHKRPPIGKLYGHMAYQQRNVGFFCHPGVSYGYFYSGQCQKAQDLPPAMAKVLDLINEEFGAQFNGLLVNHYEDGTNMINAHSDDETALDPTTGVVSLSWGAQRKFRIRKKTQGTRSGPVLCDVPTKSYHAIQMRGPKFQKDLTHEIPKEAKVTGERVSITARRHCAAEEAPLIARYERNKREREEEISELREQNKRMA